MIFIARPEHDPKTEFHPTLNNRIDRGRWGRQCARAPRTESRHDPAPGKSAVLRRLKPYCAPNGETGFLTFGSTIYS